MNSGKRPIGVLVLSLVALGVSPGLVVLLAFFFYKIYTRNEVPSLNSDPGTFIMLALWETVLSIAFLVLAWLSFKASVQLWNLKERGRHLASFSMPLFLLVGGLITADGGLWRIVSGSAICVFSVFFLIYLQLPSIRRRFQVEPTAKIA